MIFVNILLLVVNFFFSKEIIVVLPNLKGKPENYGSPKHFFVEVALN
tara:strand:+ start:600 stop:740 length:141 start_codon:yes stop_codon:yes gene_type:complete